MQHKKLGLLCTMLGLAALLGLCASASAQLPWEQPFSNSGLILNGGNPVAWPPSTGVPDGSTCIRLYGSPQTATNLRMENLADGCTTDNYGFVATGAAYGYAMIGVLLDGNYAAEGGIALADDDVFDISLRLDAPVVSGWTTNVFWLRMYPVRWDSGSGTWVYANSSRNWDVTVPINEGWACFCKRIGDFNPNSGSNWAAGDEQHIFLMRIDCVIWDPGVGQPPRIPYTFGIDHLKIRHKEAPAVTCPAPINMVGGCVNHIVLTATCNPAVDHMAWYDAGGNWLVDGLVYETDLPVGTYNYTFKAWDSTKPCDVATCSTPVTITGTAPTADAGGPYSYTVGECGVTDVPLDGTATASNPPNWDWVWKDSDGRTLGAGYASEPDISASFLPGTYTVTLTVTDYNNCTNAVDTATVTVNAPMADLPMSIPMNPQVNLDPAASPYFDAIVGALPAVPNITDDQSGALDFYAEDLTFARYYLAGGYFVGGPSIKVHNACYAPFDVTNAYVRFEARYFQEDYPGRDPAAYADAALGIRFRDANLTDFAALGTGTNITFFYGPAVPVADRYPLWKTCGGAVTLVDVRADRFGRTATFDPTQVAYVEFVSTDWSGLGNDYYDIKNVLITTDPLGACCIDENTCVPLRTQAECTALGGVSWHADEGCGGFVDMYTNAGATLAWEDVSATGTLNPACDDCGYVVPLGFTFDFFGSAITQIGMSSNGYLTTDADLGNSGNVTIPNTGSPNNMIAALWGDWNPTAGGGFYYQTLGTAPNRRFVALWKNVPYWGTTEQNTFEAILYETSNRIELRYGAVVPRSGPPTWGGATTAGVENATGTAGVYITAEMVGAGGNAAAQAFTPTLLDQRTCAAPLLGDMNCDGLVNLADVPLFVDALLGTYNVPGCDVNLANMNGDAAIDGLDTQGFVDALVP